MIISLTINISTMDKSLNNEIQRLFLESVSSYHILRVFVPNEFVRDFIACQFALESDFGRSNLARNYFNFCGMKVPSKRHFLGFGADGFACYSNLGNCICDYVSWLLYNRPSSEQLSTVASFSAFLEKVGYCPEKDYVEKIWKIYNSYYC